MRSRIEKACLEKGMKMTEQRRIIAQVLSNSTDHPDVEEVYRRASEIDDRVSIATVYRTLRLFEEAQKYALLLGYNYQSSQWYEASYKIFNSNYTKYNPISKDEKNSLLRKFKSLFK